MTLNSRVLLLSWIIHLFVFPLAQARNGGFSVDLIHRDSPKSPFYNASSSRFERLGQAFRRSLSRAAYLRHALLAPETIESHVSSIGGEYVMKVSIGTPPVEITAIADTGSDVAWTQCKPCPSCFKQNDPFFDSSKSSSYRQLSCESSLCKAVGSSSCDGNNRCKYELTYGDNSFSNGDLATETFTFDSTSGRAVSIPKVAFGCGHEDGGNFKEATSGIIGLGGGELSIVRQLDSQISGKFSYCLVPMDSNSSISSKLNFGSSAVIPIGSAIRTPLIKGDPDTFYYLHLENVSVGVDAGIEFKKSPSKHGDSGSGRRLQVDEGNMVIDSGTTLTFLPQEFYADFESAVRDAIRFKRTKDPSGLFGLCYNVKDQDFVFPEIVFHFTDADLQLPPPNTFAEVAEDVYCLTILPAEDLAIFGNFAQTNFQVEYDLQLGKLSFLEADCTKQ